jgi:general secretion pathway protein D
VGVNTQFQYIDVGVIVEIQPHVHPDNEISLKASLQISNQTGTSAIGGISQPIISQRKAEQEVRLKDGEPNILAGILEDEIDLNTNGIPFLSQIPLIKYLFQQEDKERHTNEVVFVLVPHIVRAQTWSALNQKAIDVGTAGAIDLRYASATKSDNGSKQQSAAPPASAAQQAAAQPLFLPPQQQAPPASGGPPGQVQTAMPVATNQPPGTSAQPGDSLMAKPSPATPANGPLSLHLDPETVTAAVNGNVNVNVKLAGAQDVTQVSMQLTYDPKVLQFGQASPGEFLSRDGQAVPIVKRDDPASGTLTVSAARPPGTSGVSGGGVVFSLSFTAKARGATGLAITIPSARNSQNQQVPAQGSQTTVNVN